MEDFIGIIFAVFIFIVASLLRRKQQPEEQRREAPLDVERQWEEWIEEFGEEGVIQNRQGAQNSAPAPLRSTRDEPHAVPAYNKNRTVNDSYALKAELDTHHQKSVIDHRHLTSSIENSNTILDQGLLKKTDSGIDAYRIKQSGGASRVNKFVETLSSPKNLLIASIIFGPPKSRQKKA